MLTGPAIVEVPTTTVVIPGGTTGTVDALGNLTIRPAPVTAGTAAPVTPVTPVHRWERVMTMFIPGSEVFSSRPVDPDELQRSLPSILQTHTVSQEQVDGLDPLTYEVIRHRLWMVTDEMGEALKRMSGSIVVTDANDFNFAIMDEIGDMRAARPLQRGACGRARSRRSTGRSRIAPKTPASRRATCSCAMTPGSAAGCIRTTSRSIAAGLLGGQALRLDRAPSSHQLDLGGVAPGQLDAAAPDVFWESLPTPPVKIVRGDRSSAMSRTSICAAHASRGWSRSTCARKIGANNSPENAPHAVRASTAPTPSRP